MTLQSRRGKSPLAIDSIDDRYCRRAGDRLEPRSSDSAMGGVDFPAQSLFQIAARGTPSTLRLGAEV